MRRVLRRVLPTSRRTLKLSKNRRVLCRRNKDVGRREQTEQPTQRTASAPARKMRRIGPAHSTADMGVMGAIQHLKSEGRQLRAAGIAALLQGGAGAMQPHLATYLSGTAARTYEDESGTDFAMENTSVFDKLFADGVVMNSKTGTIAAAFNAELCFNLHLDLIDQLKTTSINAVDGAPGLLLKNADGCRSRQGKERWVPRRVPKCQCSRHALQQARPRSLHLRLHCLGV